MPAHDIIDNSNEGHFSEDGKRVFSDPYPLPLEGMGIT